MEKRMSSCSKKEDRGDLIIRAAAVVEERGGTIGVGRLAKLLKVSTQVLSAALSSPENKFLEAQNDSFYVVGWRRNRVPLPDGAVDWSKSRLWRPWVAPGDTNPAKRLGGL